KGAFQGFRSQLVQAPIVNVPVAPKLLDTPWEFHRNRNGSSHLFPVDRMNLPPALRRVIGEIAYQPQSTLGLVREQTLEWLVKRRGRKVEVVMPVDANIV